MERVRLTSHIAEIAKVICASVGTAAGTSATETHCVSVTETLILCVAETCLWHRQSSALKITTGVG